MKHKASRRRGGGLGQLSRSSSVDVVMQHINALGQRDGQVPQICLWIKELYEMKDTDPKVCYSLLDKVVQKASTHHLPHRLKARLLQHEVLLLQLQPSGAPSLSLCATRTAMLKDAYQAAVQAVQLNNTSQLSISLLFALVLQLIVEVLVEHHLQHTAKWDVPVGEVGEYVDQSVELFAVAAQNIIKQAIDGGPAGNTLGGPYLIARGGQTSIDPGLQGLWSRHRSTAAFARLQAPEVSCALADESRDLQKLLLLLHEVPHPTLLDYHERLLTTLLDPSIPKWLPSCIAGPYYPIMEQMMADSGPMGFCSARGVQYTTPQYSLLYSEEQAIALMLESCRRPWQATSAADVHELYCKQLGKLGPSGVLDAADESQSDTLSYVSGMLQGSAHLPGTTTPFTLAQCLGRGYAALGGPGAPHRGLYTTLLWGAEEAAKWEHVASFWSKLEPVKQLELLCVPLSTLLQRLPMLRRKQCQCADKQQCPCCLNLGWAMEAVIHQMARVGPWDPEGAQRGAFSVGPTYLLCCPACPGPSMSATDFLMHLARFHLAPLTRQGDTLCCSLCSSKVFGTHYFNAAQQLHCIACAFCLLNGQTDSLPAGWRRACVSEVPSHLLELDQFFSKKCNRQSPPLARADSSSQPAAAADADSCTGLSDPPSRQDSATVKISPVLDGQVVSKAAGRGVSFPKPTAGGLGSLLEKLPSHVHGTAGMLSGVGRKLQVQHEAACAVVGNGNLVEDVAEVASFKFTRPSNVLQGDAANAAREKLCLPLYCAPEDKLLEQSAHFEALCEACKLDGRLDLPAVSELRLEPCRWWLEAIDKHASASQSAKRTDVSRGNTGRGLLGCGVPRGAFKAVPSSMPGPLQWVLGAMEPFQEACATMFRLMVDLEARRQGDEALRNSPRKSEAALAYPALRNLSPLADIPFAGLERIAILARHLQQRQEGVGVHEKLKAAMADMHSSAKQLDAALLSALGGHAATANGITDRMQELLTAVQMNSTLLQLNQGARLVDLAHRYTLTKIGLRDAIVLFEGYLIAALHEVAASILRTEEWQANVTCALLSKAKNAVEKETYKETYKVKLDDLAVAKEQLGAVERRKDYAREKALEVKRITDTFRTIMDSYEARKRSVSSASSLGSYMEHLNLLLRANVQDMLLQEPLEKDYNLAVQAMEQHMSKHDGVLEALVQVALLANTSPAVTIITAEVRQLIESQLVHEAAAASDKAFQELLEKEEEQKAAQKAKACKKAAKKRAAKEAAATAAAAAVTPVAVEDENDSVTTAASDVASDVAVDNGRDVTTSDCQDAADAGTLISPVSKARSNEPTVCHHKNKVQSEDELHDVGRASGRHKSGSNGGTADQGAVEDAKKTLVMGGSADHARNYVEDASQLMIFAGATHEMGQGNQPSQPVRRMNGTKASNGPLASLEQSQHLPPSVAKQDRALVAKGVERIADKQAGNGISNAPHSDNRIAPEDSATPDVKGKQRWQGGPNATSAADHVAGKATLLLPPQPRTPAALGVPQGGRPPLPPLINAPHNPVSQSTSTTLTAPIVHPSNGHSASRPPLVLPPGAAGPMPGPPLEGPGVIHLPRPPPLHLEQGGYATPATQLRQPRGAPGVPHVPPAVVQHPAQQHTAVGCSAQQSASAADNCCANGGLLQQQQQRYGARYNLGALQDQAVPVPKGTASAVQHSRQAEQGAMSRDTLQGSAGSSLFSTQPSSVLLREAHSVATHHTTAARKEADAPCGMQQFTMGSPLQEGLQEALLATRQQVQGVPGMEPWAQSPSNGQGSWLRSQLHGNVNMGLWSTGIDMLQSDPFTTTCPIRSINGCGATAGGNAPQQYSLFGGGLQLRKDSVSPVWAADMTQGLRGSGAPQALGAEPLLSSSPAFSLSSDVTSLTFPSYPGSTAFTQQHQLSLHPTPPHPTSLTTGFASAQPGSWLSSSPVQHQLSPHPTSLPQSTSLPTGVASAQSGGWLPGSPEHSGVGDAPLSCAASSHTVQATPPGSSNAALWAVVLHSLMCLDRLPHMLLQHLQPWAIQHTLCGQVAQLVGSAVQQTVDFQRLDRSNRRLDWGTSQQLDGLMHEVFHRQQEGTAVGATCTLGSALLALLQVLDAAIVLTALQQRNDVDASAMTAAAAACTAQQVLEALRLSACGPPCSLLHTSTQPAMDDLRSWRQHAFAGLHSLGLQCQLGAAVGSTAVRPCAACGASCGAPMGVAEGREGPPVYMYNMSLRDLVASPSGSPMQHFISPPISTSLLCIQCGNQNLDARTVLTSVPVLLPVALCWEGIPPDRQRTALQQRIVTEAPGQLLLREAMQGMLCPSVPPSVSYVLRGVLCWHNVAGYVSINVDSADCWTVVAQDESSTVLSSRTSVAEACCDVDLQLQVLLYELV